MVEFIRADDADSGRASGPVAFARKVFEGVQLAKAEEKEVDVSGEMASVRIENNRFGGYMLKMRFHENQMNDDFVFRGSNDSTFSPGVAARETASEMSEFTGDVGTLADILSETLDLLPWEFAELNAASIGGAGNLTDYEFVYEAQSSDNPPDERTFNERLERATGSGQSAQGRFA